MRQIIDTIGLNKCNFIDGRSGKFRAIVKCRGGFMTVVECRDYDNDLYSNHPASVLTNWKKGALQTVEFQPAGSSNWLTVFARTGKQIKVIDTAILEGLDVGTVNSYWVNTNLYNQIQYQTVGAKTWADRAFVDNSIEEEPITLQAIPF
jgi:hypothetical protein